MNRMKSVSLSVFFLLTVVFLISCGGNTKQDDVFVYGMYKEAVTLDPARITDTQSNIIISNVCEGLLGYTGENTKFFGKLAEKWDVSDGGKTYTFHLRKNVVFDDGKTPFNADSVLFSFNRMNDKNHPYFMTSPYWNGFGFHKSIMSIGKKDDDTVVIKLNKPESTFLSKLALQTAFIVNPTVYKKDKEAFARNPSCAGPFKFVEWKKGQMIVLERNEHYYNKNPKAQIKKVVAKFLPDASARLLALQKGEIDVAEMIEPQDAKAVEEDKNLNLVQKPVLYQTYMHISVEKPPFDNVKVRRALVHLLDKEALVKTAVLGYGNAVVNPIPKAMWGYDESIPEYEYNVEKAKKLLAEAGYPNGFSMEILYNKENEDRKTFAEIAQASFKKANIDVTIKNLEWGTFLGVTNQRNYKGIAISGWGADYMDPDSYLVMIFSANAAIKPGLNKSGWSNKKFDEYNEQALLTNDRNERIALYKKSQKIFHDEMPAIPIYDRVHLIGMKKEVKNFYFSPLNIAYFGEIQK